MKYYSHNGREISALGLGTTNLWRGLTSSKEEVFLAAVQKYGINVIDTAELYGDSEKHVGELLKKMDRDSIFLIDKIHPDNCTEAGFDKSLQASLKKLNTGYIDLYLLHWREKVDLALLVRKMEQAVKDGYIREWGVSNFDVSDLQDLFEYCDDINANQIFYSVYERGIEFELLDLMHDRNILPVSYSSLGSHYYERPDIHENREIMELCRQYGVSPEAVMLRMITDRGVLALFSTSSLDHLEDNLQEVDDEAFRVISAAIDRVFPSPDYKYPMVKI